MKRLIAALCASLIYVSVAFAQEGRTLPEGLKPYTPSRIEWLAMDLNASMRVPFDDGFSMDFMPAGKGNAILILVKYAPSVNREIMNKYIETARYSINSSAKANGWSSWLKIEERIEMIKPKTGGP